MAKSKSHPCKHPYTALVKIKSGTSKCKKCGAIVEEPEVVNSQDHMMPCGCIVGNGEVVKRCVRHSND